MGIINELQNAYNTLGPQGSLIAAGLFLLGSVLAANVWRVK